MISCIIKSRDEHYCSIKFEIKDNIKYYKYRGKIFEIIDPFIFISNQYPINSIITHGRVFIPGTHEDMDEYVSLIKKENLKEFVACFLRFKERINNRI